MYFIFVFSSAGFESKSLVHCSTYSLSIMTNHRSNPQYINITSLKPRCYLVTYIIISSKWHLNNVSTLHNPLQDTGLCSIMFIYVWKLNPAVSEMIFQLTFFFFICVFPIARFESTPLVHCTLHNLSEWHCELVIPLPNCTIYM